MHKLKGTVSQGNAIGRTLGFPTANIVVGDTPGLSDGVYAARVRTDGVWREAMANLGRRPTVEEGCGERLLEVNIFDFEGELYGRTIEVELLRYIRPEKRFASLALLREAVERDREAVREYFQNRKICL